MKKPPFCSGCPLAPHSTGFVPDWCPRKPLFAVVLKMPDKDEIVTGEPMTGKAGRYWEKEFLKPMGIDRHDVIIANTIRCYPNGKGEFPVGKLKEQALGTCRHWDQAVKDFKPNLWGVTFNPAALLRNPQQTKFVKRAFQRVREYALKGYRPALLCGEEAREVYAPWLQGTMKKWQGHWWEEKWAA